MRRTLGRRQPRVQTLEIFKREAALIGVEGGEIPAVGEDPEARGLERLSEGDTLEVPTGRSVLDVLQLSGMCEDGQLATRDEERRENFRGDLRWHQGENDPNPKGWKKIDKLAQVDPSWFCKLMPDETRPIRFGIIDQDTKNVESHTTLILKRVAGQAQRITFKEADTDDTDDGERGASARYEAEACDSLANSAHRCACAARRWPRCKECQLWTLSRLGVRRNCRAIMRAIVARASPAHSCCARLCAWPRAGARRAAQEQRQFHIEASTSTKRI